MTRTKTFLRYFTILLLTVASLTFACSCDAIFKDESKYEVYRTGNEIHAILPNPTIGISGVNEVDWHGVDINEVIEKMYDCGMESDIVGEARMIVGYRITSTDKYGNTTSDTVWHEIARIPMGEFRKYRSAHYLDQSYRLSEGFHNSAFGKRKQ